jgi:hypothetical protein
MHKFRLWVCGVNSGLWEPIFEGIDVKILQLQIAFAQTRPLEH